MTKADALKAWALEKVGSPYVMGGTGKPCTPAYRKARAAQYPGSAAKIAQYCPVMSGRQSACAGCKYAGKLAYDCAQLVRWGCRAAGIDGMNISGATSQWNKGDFAKKGEIAGMPGGVCLLYRQSGSTMAHTGISLGDGTVAHAKGHAAGVVRDAIGAGKWTHFALPKGMEEESAMEQQASPEGADGGENMATDVVAVYRVTGNRLALRERPSAGAAILLRIATNELVEGLEAPEDGWVRARYGGKTGYCMLKYLRCIEDEPEGAQPGAGTANSGAIALDGEAVAAIKSAAQAILEALEGGTGL